MRLMVRSRRGGSVARSRRSARALLAGLLTGLLTAGVALAPASPVFAADDPATGLRVMPLGDSITFGKGDPASNGYRATLCSWLTEAGVPVDFVGSQHNGTGADNDHEGHPGWRIAQLTDGIDQWMADSTPDVVLLDIGTNDLLHHDHLAEAPDRLRTLLDHIVISNPQVQILLAELLVVDDGHAADFQAYNAAVAELAAQYPANVTLVDMSAVPVANTVDHVHPNALGYQQMAFQWYEALRGVLPSGRSWSPVPPS
ncbi:SGNH/GDSL hydrolase family protein [Paractinoplanes globisporus]|uniref:SGNH/GDSL hydrolase family protein n=1 Tax=Paractinoplanes globisporus TaxID=113565 RepID=A0ABW6WAH5_9ACTN|nr:SGNH/GDSL hydrolase family protein [Actinoplanes globisporus]